MSLIKKYILNEEVSEKKKDVIQNNIRKRLYKIFKHEGHMESILSFPKDVLPLSDEDREKYIRSNVLNWDKRITKALIEIDPTDNGQYLSWLYKIFIKNDQYLPTHPDKLMPVSDTVVKIREDSSRVRQYLKLFDENKPLIKRQGNSVNINDYDSQQELLDVVDKFRHKTGEGTLQISKDLIEKNYGDEAEIFYESDEWIIVIPRTERASCELGVDSEWCTADGHYSPREDKRSRRGAFKSYKNDPLFIVQNKQDPEELYQFSFDSGEFMDKKDRRIDIIDFYQDNPDIQEAFENKGYFVEGIAKVDWLIRNEEYEDAVKAINDLGYGYIGVEDMDSNTIITSDSIDNNSEEILKELWGIKINENMIYLSNFLVNPDEFLKGTLIDIKLDNIYNLFSNEEKKKIIRNTITKHKRELKDNINISLPLDDIFEQVFEFLNKKHKMFKDEFEISRHYINKDKLKNLREYLEDIANRIGFQKHDVDYLYSIYYDSYESIEYYIHDSRITDMIYQDLNEMDRIKEDIVNDLDDDIQNKITYIKENKLEFESFEELVLFLCVDNFEYIGLTEMRNKLVLLGYLETIDIPTKSKDQQRLKFNPLPDIGLPF